MQVADASAISGCCRTTPGHEQQDNRGRQLQGHGLNMRPATSCDCASSTERDRKTATQCLASMAHSESLSCLKYSYKLHLNAFTAIMLQIKTIRHINAQAAALPAAIVGAVSCWPRTASCKPPKRCTTRTTFIHCPSIQM